MSDLQCPARFLVLTDVADAAASWPQERVAAVYDGRTGRAAPGPEASGLAARLGVRATGCPQLLRSDVVVRAAGALAVLCDLADLHRGETVVVLPAGEPGPVLEVRVDADGVRVEVSPAAARSRWHGDTTPPEATPCGPPRGTAR